MDTCILVAFRGHSHRTHFCITKCKQYNVDEHCGMRKVLQKTWNTCSVIKHVRLVHLYIKKQWKSRAVEFKITFFVNSPLLEVLKRLVYELNMLCIGQETQEYTKTVVRYCLETLQMWFDAIGFVDEVQSWHLHCKIVLINVEPVSNLFISLSQPALNQLTFHLPLHRYYAMFLSKVSLTQSHTLRTCSSGVPESISVFEPIGWVNSSTSHSKTVTCHSYL